MSMTQGPNGPAEIDFEMRAKAAFDQIDDKARQMGLYSEHAHAHQLPTGEMVLIVDFMIGDIAFSDRVQNPERYGTDTMIRTMEKSMATDDFLDQRERLKQRLAEGKDPFLDDDEDLGN